MPSLAIAFSSRTVTSTPSFSSALARSANSAGKSTFGGSLTRSRANSTPSATANRSCEADRAAAAWLAPISEFGRLTVLLVAVLLLRLVFVELVGSEPQAQGEIRGGGRVPGARGPFEGDLDLLRARNLAEGESAEHDEVERGIVLGRRNPDDHQARGVEPGRRQDIQRRLLRALEMGRLGRGADQRFEVAELRGDRRSRLHVRADKDHKRAALGRSEASKGDLDRSAHSRCIPGISVGRKTKSPHFSNLRQERRYRNL